MPQPDTSHVPITHPTPPLDEGLRITLPAQASSQERWLWRGLLVVLCLLAYIPSISPEFLWDDNRHANASTTGALNMRDFDGLVRIWTQLGLENGGTPQYYPLTHTVYWLEYHIWGKSAIAYRVFNILLHAGGALVLWELLRRLRVPGAFVAAGLFAIHPLMVESVAWTSEQKNTQSLLLALTAVLFYCKFAGLTEDEAEAVDHSRKEVDWNLYAIAVLAFVGAVLSKTVAGVACVWIPLILWWKGRLTARHLGLIAPMFAFAFAMGLVTSYVEHRHVIRPGAGMGEETFLSFLGAKLTGTLSSGPEFQTPFSQRLLMAGVVPFFYAMKVIAPVELVFFYPRWDLAAAPGWWWLAHVALLGILAGLVVLAMRGKRWPLACLLGYLAALFPAMGFVDVYPFRYSFVADHFSYHAAWILLTLIAVGVALLAERVRLTLNPGMAIAATAGLFVAFAVRTYVHAGNFIDNTELFSHTLKHNSGSWAAAHNLARERILQAQKAQRAQRQYLAAREPQLAAEAQTEADAFLTEAQRLLDKTLELKPDHDWAHYTMGLVALLRNDGDRALEMFRKSAEVRENPNINRDGPYAETYVRIADILQSKGDLDGAAANYRKAISLEKPPFQPRSGPVRLSLLKLELRRIAAANRLATTPTTAPSDLTPATEGTPPPPASTLPVTRPTTRVAPYPGATAEQLMELFNLAADMTELMPRNDESWTIAAKIMYTLGHRGEALAAFREAVAINDRNVDALVGMGITLGELGDIVGARVAFQEALKLSPGRADAAQALAIADVLLGSTGATTRPTSQPFGPPPTSDVTPSGTPPDATPLPQPAGP